MSESTPSVDTPIDNETTASAIEALLPKVIAQINEAVEGQGKKVVQHKCSACGEKQTVEVPIADVDLLVKALPALSNAHKALQAAKTDPTTTRAARLLADRSGLTDAELAEYIASLEASLA